MGGLTSRLTRVLPVEDGIHLESGARLAPVTVAYRTWGRLAGDGGNAVLVCHALTGSADLDRWWGGLLGDGRAFDPRRDYVVCSNVLGSCYGTTGPVDPEPGTGERWGADFPAVTVRDMVRIQHRLLEHLGVRRLRLVAGGSLGGMQALEWGLMFPEVVESVVALGATARHSPWCISISEAQRAAIRADPRWRGGRYPPDDPPVDGLAAARMMAMCSYRSPSGLGSRFERRHADDGVFECVSWLRHHGEALVRRFDAASYLALTETMDSHDVGRGRGGSAAALGGLRPRTLVVGITSDVLYPPEEQRELAAWIPGAALEWIHSPHGHDAFLIEMDQVDGLIRRFRGREKEPSGRRSCAS